MGPRKIVLACSLVALAACTRAATSSAAPSQLLDHLPPDLTDDSFAVPAAGERPEHGRQRTAAWAVVTVGEAALTGWRGSVGRAIAKPIAKRTRFDVEQIEAVLGLVLLAYTVYRVGRPLIRAARSRS